MSTENRTGIPNSLHEHWMPFTSNKNFKKDPRLITEAKGVYLKAHKGGIQIDASERVGNCRKLVRVGMFECKVEMSNKEMNKAVMNNIEKLKDADREITYKNGSEPQ